MNKFIFLIRMAGTIQLLMVLAQPIVSRKLEYKKNLALLAPIVRQVFIIQYFYLSFVLILFSILCLGFAPYLLGGTPVARLLTGFMTLFWSLRLLIQLFYFDPAAKKMSPIGNVFFTSCFIFLSLVFALTTPGVL